jgi:hypothetical protein
VVDVLLMIEGQFRTIADRFADTDEELRVKSRAIA